MSRNISININGDQNHDEEEIPSPEPYSTPTAIELNHYNLIHSAGGAGTQCAISQSHGPAALLAVQPETKFGTISVSGDL
jgi:hypothetical protein